MLQDIGSAGDLLALLVAPMLAHVALVPLPLLDKHKLAASITPHTLHVAGYVFAL